MANTSLTAGQIDKMTTLGLHRVADGLYLQVRQNGAKSWILRYQRNGRSRMMGLGPAKLVNRSDAIARARRAQVQLMDGIDPIDTRRQTLAPSKPIKIAPTFEVFAGSYIEAHRAGWANAKHVQQWENTLATYAYPVLGKMPVSDIGVEDVLKVLKPIWTTKPETASRLRGRIEQILGAAEAAKHRTGPNPASWKGALRHLLPALSTVQRVEHHAAVPYGEVPKLFATIGERDGQSARALAFVLLTAARSGEVRGARWSEIDLKEKVWVVPAERMKMKREHRVPLSDAAIAALPRQGSPNALVFPGAKGKALSDMSLITAMRRILGMGSTVHGLRSSFRDWAAEATDFPREIVESALAHQVGNEVERAYLRTSFFDKRRDLMDAWAAFVVGSSNGK